MHSFRDTAPYSILITAYLRATLHSIFYRKFQPLSVIKIVILFSAYLLATHRYVTRSGTYFQILKRTRSAFILGSFHKHKTKSIPVLHESKSNKDRLYRYMEFIISVSSILRFKYLKKEKGISRFSDEMAFHQVCFRRKGKKISFCLDKNIL